MATTTTTDVRPPSTSDGVRQRAASACGALFTLGIVIGDDVINRAGEPPTPMDRADDSIVQVENYLASAADAVASGSYWVGRGIGSLALVALLVFSVHVAHVIRRREDGAGMLSGVALGAGLVAVALGLVSCTAQFAAVVRADEGIEPQIARALLDVSGLTFVLMWLPIATFMASLAMAGRRYDLLPRWLTTSTGLLSAALFAGLASLPVGNAGFIAIVLGFLWFVVTSVWFVRRPS